MAGCAASIALARKGRVVTLIEREPTPRHKVCGEFLSGEALEDLHALGIDVASYPKYLAKDLYRSFGLGPAIFFDKETFGADRLVANPAPLGGSEDEEHSLRVEFLLEPRPFAQERLVRHLD